MRRFGVFLLCAALLLTLAGCSKAAGGSYKLEYITADGMRIPPGGFGMSIYLNLEEEGRGTATYSDTTLDITWEDNGSTVTVTGPNGVLKFTQDGKSLILHDEGTLLFFKPIEEDD